MIKQLRSAISVLLLTASLMGAAFAAPSPTGVSGTVGSNQSYTIVGNSFGTKSPAKPYIWAPFDTSINPSSLGTVTSWDVIGNVSWAASEGYSGGGAKSADGNGNWTLGTVYNTGWTSDGQRFYIYKRHKLNYLITDTRQNYKTWRMWASDNTPDIYTASNNGRCYTEYVGDTPDPGFWSNFNIGVANQWVIEEHVVQASTLNNKNGSLDYRVNGQSMASGAILTRSNAVTTGSDVMTLNYVMHDVLANVGLWVPAWSTNNRSWTDDIYVDITWSRVMIGDAATITACSQLSPQPPSAWGANSITVTGNTDGFSQGAHAFLYVFDNAGNVNSSGLAVTIGAAGSGGGGGGGGPPPPTPPTLSSISPNHGPAAGPTHVTLSGANIASAFSVTIGGLTCTNPVFNGATSVTCDAPNGTAGTSATVVLTNTADALSSTLTNGFSYDTVINPTITSVTPTHGPASGNTTIAVVGTNFQNTSLAFEDLFTRSIDSAITSGTPEFGTWQEQDGSVLIDHTTGEVYSPLAEGYGFSAPPAVCTDYLTTLNGKTVGVSSTDIMGVFTNWNIAANTGYFARLRGNGVWEVFYTTTPDILLSSGTVSVTGSTYYTLNLDFNNTSHVLTFKRDGSTIWSGTPPVFYTGQSTGFFLIGTARYTNIITTCRTGGLPFINIGNASCTGVVYVDANDLTCNTPPGAEGPAVGVTVINPNGQSATKASAFRYDIRPASASIPTAVLPWVSH